jgi:hypothetical protein
VEKNLGTNRLEITEIVGATEIWKKQVLSPQPITETRREISGLCIFKGNPVIARVAGFRPKPRPA